MNRRDALRALLALSGSTVPLTVISQATRPVKLPKIVLFPGLHDGYRSYIAGMLKEFGWVEGRDFNFGGSYIEYRTDVVDEYANQILGERPDLVFVIGDGHAAAMHRLTATIPIVMWGGGYPVEAGLANSLARPGKNITGNSIYAGTGLWGKLVELLRDAKPGIKRIATLSDYVPPFVSRQVTDMCMDEMRAAARAYRIALHIAEVSGPDEVQAAMAKISASRPDALIATSGPSLGPSQQRVAQFAVDKRLPLIVDFHWPKQIVPYPMLVYAPPVADLARSAVSYVDKILKGAKPGDLPIQLPARFELVVDMRTAKAIRLKIPQSFMMRADRVIE